MQAWFMACVASTALVTAAVAQSADKQTTPGNAPTKAMDKATPEMKGTGTGEHPPTGKIDQAVPPMKSGDAAAAGPGSSECDAAWAKANPNNDPTITEAQAQQYVADVKAANPDNDGTLDKAEFTKACDSGLVAK